MRRSCIQIHGLPNYRRMLKPVLPSAHYSFYIGECMQRLWRYVYHLSTRNQLKLFDVGYFKPSRTRTSIVLFNVCSFDFKFIDIVHFNETNHAVYQLLLKWLPPWWTKNRRRLLWQPHSMHSNYLDYHNRYHVLLKWSNPTLTSFITIHAHYPE